MKWIFLNFYDVILPVIFMNYIASIMKKTILLFHRVNTLRDKLWDPMSPELFDKTMRYLSKNYDVLPLKELCLQQVKVKRPLAISFDDGYKDFIDVALPIMKTYQLPSSMYVVTDCVDKNLPTWTYVMDYLFFNTKKLEIGVFDYGEKCAAFARYKWADKEAQLQYVKKFKQFLKHVDNGQREKIMAHFLRELDDVQIPGNLMMSWHDLRSLKNQNVEIGSHTFSHPPLATITNQEVLEKELKLSGEIIQQQLGFFPSTISYPVGSYNEQVKAASKKAGYSIGLAVDQKIYDPRKHDLFSVPRIELYNDSFLRTKLKIHGIEAAVRSILKR